MVSPLAGVAMATKFTGEETVAPFCGEQTTTPGLEGALQLEGGLVVPVPDRDTVCGLPPAESVTVIDPVRVPVCDGVKVMLIVQLAPAFKVAGQLLDCEKSPLATMLLMVRAAPPLLVRVIA